MKIVISLDLWKKLKAVKKIFKLGYKKNDSNYLAGF